MISEIERVLKTGGVFYLQIQLGLNQDEYTVFEVNNPVYDIVTLFDQSFCLGINKINEDGSINFAGMNVELIFRKDKTLEKIYKKWGSIKNVSLPKEYENLWKDINLPIQIKKLDNANIKEEEVRNKILDNLSKRAYYLTRIANEFKSKNILEIGTAEGWQFFSFGEYAKDIQGLVVSCDIRDVRSKKHIDDYKGTCYYFRDTSKFLGESNQIPEIDFFYIDGSHDKGDVINDVVNLVEKQNKKINPVWVFDDFDIRFGCYEDICNIINMSSSNGFKVWNVGLTASGKPSHQVMINNRFQVK